MSNSDGTLVERIHKLGIECETVPTDRLTSAVSALGCFPMYMVANQHAWHKEQQWSIPLVDVPGFEAIREAFAIGRQEKALHIEPAHRVLLGTLLGHAKPSDRVIYDYALDTLVMLLDSASAEVATELRTAIAKTIIAVASASGEGLFGTGEKINRHEFETIEHIATVLNLRKSAEAAKLLEGMERD